jgi:hypothetical protein
MKTITLELDVVDLENDNLKAITERSRDGGVELTVLDPHGPGGGNPFCKVEGPRLAVLGWLVAEYTQDVTEAELMVGTAGE